MAFLKTQSYQAMTPRFSMVVLCAVVFIVGSCSSQPSQSTSLLADARVTDEIGRTREVVDLVLELRQRALSEGKGEVWYGFAERATVLAESASVLSMERARVLTSTPREQAEFYDSVEPRLDALAQSRGALRTEALALATSSG